jgi:hypothetical protein
MTSTITNLVPGKRVQLPGMPCLVLKRQAVEQLLRERAEQVNLRLLECIDPAKSRYPWRRARLGLRLESHGND